MRLALLIVAALVVAVPALAHSWYPLARWGSMDCFPIACVAKSGHMQCSNLQPYSITASARASTSRFISHRPRTRLSSFSPLFSACCLVVAVLGKQAGRLLSLHVLPTLSVSPAQSMSASLRKRPKCCVAAKRRYVPQADHDLRTAHPCLGSCLIGAGDHIYR